MPLPMKKKGTDMSAMDALMDSQGAEDASAEPVAEAKVDKQPKGDPGELISSIQSQLDELSQLLS